ncbi:retrovirus-related pol polyprotein from transposon TNT 1-94 [Tanacetum coccineum]
MFVPTGSTLPTLQTVKDLQGDELFHYDAEIELMNLILLSIPNEIHACTRQEVKRVERLMGSLLPKPDDVQTNYEDPLTSAMLLLARAITQNFSNPTNNHLRTSSNTRNQAIIQGDRMNIQRLETLDEAGVILTDEQNDFLFADASRMEEIEELSANICLMARIQPADNTSDAGPSYDSAFISEVQSSSIKDNQEQMYPTHTKIINSTIGDDQIDSNIIFDKPNGNVNSGSVEKDTHVPDLYALEQLARNAYKEAEKQQLFAQKVQQQNTTLTSQLELYKERVRVLENIKGDNNYLNEFLEADRQAKHFNQQAQSQFVRDRDIIRDLEKQRDKLDLAVTDYKRKNEELQKTHLILKRQMSENEDHYHDTILDLEAKLKKNVDLILKLGNSLQGMFMLGPKSLSVYDSQLKYGLGFPNPYTLKQAISQCPNLYHASSQNNSLHAEIEQIKKNSIEIQEGLRAKIKILEKDVQRCQKQSVDFELKLQHEKEKHKWESNLNNKNTNPLDYSWISKMEKLENENVYLEFQVHSLIKERDNVKLEYQKLFDSIKKTRSQSQKEMDELIDHVSKKTYAYGAIRAENRNLLSTISELKTRLDTVEKGMNVASSVRRPMNRDSHVKNSVLANSKNSAKKVAVYVVQIVLWIVDSGCSKHMTGDRSLLKNFIEKFMGTVRFGNDNFAAITGYGDYIQGNITICHVYYVEGLGHNLFSVGQFCDGDLEVAFRSKTCYVRNLEGDDLLTGGRESNLYTISISDMAASSPVCLMSKATSTKSWLWHRRLSHLNFGTINDLTRLDLVDGLPKFKYGKDHLCSACERGKSKKASHPLKLVPSDHSKLELLHMDLCGPMRVASINGKKYILVIVDDYSRYTWVYFLHSKDETPEIIKKFIAQAQLNYKAKVCKIRTDNGTEFKNATLKAHYEKLGIMQQFSTARTPQQNGVVERRNRTLVEAARTMLIFSRLPEFLWAEAVATACFTQNRSIIHTRHNKTPYELLCGRKPNVEYFHVFGSLCYLTNDRDDLGKMKPKANIGVFIGYSETSRGFRIYNRRTKKIMETINVKFDELTAMASKHDYSPSTSSIIVDEHEAPPIVTTSDKQASLISLTEADAFNQEDSADFDGNSQFVSYNPPSHEEIESSTTALEPSNVQNFHQVQPSTHIWTKDHPIDQVIGDPSKPVMTRQKLQTDSENKCNAENIVVRNKTHLVAKGYRQEEGIDFEESFLPLLVLRLFEYHVYRLKKALYGLKQAPRACQSQYAIELLKKHGLDECVLMSIPMATKRLDADLQGTPTDQTTYRCMIGGLMYLTVSRPEISYATFICARYQARPTVKHLKEVKRIFWYLRQSYNMGLWYPKDSEFELIAYSYVDHAGCKDDCKSTSGGLQFLDYGYKYNRIPMYCDSKSAIAISCNPAQHSNTKHIDIRYHFIKEHVEKGTVEIYFVRTEYQLADLFTKALPKECFEYLVHRIGFTMELKTSSSFKTTGVLQPWQTLCKIFSKCLTTRITGWDQPPLKTQRKRWNEDSRLDDLRRNEAHISIIDVWICQILQEFSQKRTRERMSDQEAKEIKSRSQRNHASAFHNKQDLTYNSRYVPLTQSQPTESTQGTHRTPSSSRSTRLTPPAPVPTVDKADEMILQDTLQNVIDDSSIPRNDDQNILGTRLEHRSDKESPEVAITNNEEVEITNVVIPVNVNEEEEEITEVYELKRMEKGKIVEESRSIPFPTPIRSPRIHTNLVSSDTRKLQELTEVMVESLPTMVDKHIKEQVKTQVPEQVKVQVPERGKLQVKISSQIQKAIDTNIPSLVDASVRSYMYGHILHVHPA